MLATPNHRSPEMFGNWSRSVLHFPEAWDGSSQPPAPNTIRDISRQIFFAAAGLATAGPSEGVVWRGQARADWRIESKLGRQVPVDSNPAAWERHERHMIGEARRIGADNAQHQSDLEILARLRHHGAATRLIDFTQDPMVGLWFACATDDFSETDLHDGVLVALTRSSVVALADPWNFRYDDIDPLSERVQLASLPALDPRITAQRGVFLFADRPRTRSEDGLTELQQRLPNGWTGQRMLDVCSTVTWADRRGAPVRRFPDLMGIVVPSVVKKEIRRILDASFGFTRKTMYPDFPGLAQSFQDFTF